MNGDRQMADIYEEYFQEECDENNCLRAVQTHCPEDFNFAYDVMDRHAKERPTDIALVHKSADGVVKRFTFAQIRKLSDRAANVFLSDGIQRGDAVMLLLKRRYEFWISVLALHKLGAVAVPTSHMVSAQDIEERIGMAGVKAILCVGEESICEKVTQAVQAMSDRNIIRYVVGAEKDGFVNFEKSMEKAQEDFSRVFTDVWDDMLYYFTSGTSGAPKAVIHDFSYPIAHIFTAKYWHGVRPGYLHLTVADSGWAKSAWGKMYGQWFLGATVMVYDYEQFYARDLLKLIQEEKINTFCAPPTVYKYFVRENLQEFDFSSLFQATTAGEPMPGEVAEKFAKMTGLTVREGFGQTETALLICTQVGREQTVGSIGKASPLYHLELVDENNRPVEPGEEGEIVIVPDGTETGKDREIPTGIFKGYLGDQTLYEEVWAGGVYHTRDRAYKDQAGNFYFVGRGDDVIKSSGYRIGPSEVEEILIRHPAVFECAVTGYPSKTRGTVVKASIILNKGYAPYSALKTELQEYVKGRAAIYKYPRVISFVDVLPRTANGKISRAKIREMDLKENS